MDVVAVLVFSLFTFSMTSSFFAMRTWQFHVVSAVFAVAGAYYLVRGIQNLRSTWRGRASFRV